MTKKVLFCFLIFTLATPIAFSTSTETQNLITGGNQLLKEKKYPEAIKKYEEVLKAEPKNVTAHLFLGLTHANIGELDLAIKHLSEASKIDSSYASFYYLGLVYAAKNEPEKSIEAFDQALRVSPDSSMAEYQKGLVYTSQESYDKAAKSYQRALELNPQFDDARLALAGVLYKQGDKPSALNQAEELRKQKKDSLAKALEEWLNEKQP